MTDYLKLIENHIDLRADELLWWGHPPRVLMRSALFFSGLTFTIFLASFGVVEFYKLIASGQFTSDFLFNKRGVYGLASWLGSVISIIILLWYNQNQKTMIYGFTRTKAFWIRRSWKIIINELPYSDIAKLDLVGRTDDPTTFTIYFTPLERLDFIGYNYERNSSRPFPTFELIPEGDKVFCQLQAAYQQYVKVKKGLHRKVRKKIAF